MYQEPLTTSNGITSIDTTTSATNVTSDFTATLSNDDQTVTFTLIGGSAIDRTAGQTNVGYLTTAFISSCSTAAPSPTPPPGPPRSTPGATPRSRLPMPSPPTRDRPVTSAFLRRPLRHGVAQHPGRSAYNLANTNGTTDNGYLDYYDTGSLNIQSARDFNRDYTVDYNY